MTLPNIEVSQEQFIRIKARLFVRRHEIGFISSVYDQDGDHIDPHFSWHPCNCCGSSLGGDRYKITARYLPNDEIVTLSGLCVDCYIELVS